VVALESFVGEKERGTIEPLLSSPLEDRHMYLGKLLVGTTMPLVFSFLSIVIYLVLVSRRDVAFPSTYMLTLILLLTFAHAVLMVSAAIVISAQSTTIRSANLTASFIIVPVAFLLQGEAILIFWGNEDVLWYAIIGVTILSGLLVRLGLAHFKREYLLGREIDTLNFKNISAVFMKQFWGDAKSLFNWYRVTILPALRQLALPTSIIGLLGLVSILGAYYWVIANIPSYIEISPERTEAFRELVNNNIHSLDNLDEFMPVPRLFFYNARTILVEFFIGLISFGTLGVTLFIGNFALIGGVLGIANLIGFSPFLLFAAGILPHGMFELLAITIATAALLRVGALLVTPNTERSLGETFLLSLSDWFKVFVSVVLPLLAVAAVIEIYVTPLFIKLVIPYL
jgi:uncharacterized membrane protein SpoIIM required for sporulation/ABC-type transport system involved in multi-copper enzyme maturation permease subunit